MRGVIIIILYRLIGEQQLEHSRRLFRQKVHMLMLYRLYLKFLGHIHLGEPDRKYRPLEQRREERQKETEEELATC